MDALLEAVKHDDEDTLHNLLSSSPDMFNLAIELAVANTRVSMVQNLLCVAPADTNLHDATQLAFTKQDEDMVHLLLSDPRTTDPTSFVAMAAHSGMLSVVDRLLNEHEVEDSILQSALCAATRKCHVHVVRRLLQHPRSNPNEAMAAVLLTNNAEMMQVLLQDPRFDPAANDNKALKKALERRNINMVRMLLVDPRITTLPPLTLVQVVCSGDLDTVRMLLADPRVDLAAGVNKVLHAARCYSQTAMLELLCRDARVTPDGSILWFAAATGAMDLMRILLADSRVDPTVGDNLAFRMAVEKNHPDMVRLLLADPRIRPVGLRAAIHKGFVEIVELMLQDPRTDVAQLSRVHLSIALFRGRHDLVQLLLSNPRVAEVIQRDRQHEQRGGRVRTRVSYREASGRSPVRGRRRQQPTLEELAERRTRRQGEAVRRLASGVQRLTMEQAAAEEGRDV